MGRSIHRYQLDNLQQRPKFECGTLAGSTVEVRDFYLLPHVDRYYTWASFQIVVEETIVCVHGKYTRGVTEAGRSPSVSWHWGPTSTLIDYWCLSMCAALVRQEVVGKTAERMIYDLFYRGFMTSKELEAWVKERCPSFYQSQEGVQDGKAAR